MTANPMSEKNLKKSDEDMAGCLAPKDKTIDSEMFVADIPAALEMETGFYVFFREEYNNSIVELATDNAFLEFFSPATQTAHCCVAP